MNIILDLDETLVSVTTESVRDYDFKFSLPASSSHSSTPVSLWYYGRKRPFLDQFLKYIFSRFRTVSIWTAATREYAQQVIRGIMTPEQITRLSFVNTRGDLKVTKGSYTKPLSKIFSENPNIKKNNTLMIDDRRSVMIENLGNGIVIPPFNGTKTDVALKQLIVALNGILQISDQLGFDKYTEVIYLKDIVS